MTAADLPSLGENLRDARQRRGLTLRALAGQVGVSASMISQIEKGRTQPSVSTLFAITTALGISIQEVFDGADGADGADGTEGGTDGSADGGVAGGAPGSTVISALGTTRGQRTGPVVRPLDRHALTLDTGVIWERLGELPPHSVDFILVTYPPGGASSSAGGLMRHPGSEFGYLVSGELTLTLGFEKIHLTAGDAISFESSTPHSYCNEGTEPAVGVWFVIEP